MVALSGYSTGTISIGAGATAAVGASTIWNNTNARAGDILIVAGHQVVVQDVTDTSHLVIDAWPFTAVSAGTAYLIAHVSPLRYGANAQLAKDTSDVLAVLNTSGYFVFVDAALSVPDPSLGEDNQFALQASTKKLWFKTGGIWNFYGYFSGFGIPAPYDNAHTYNLFDIATSAGSSYVFVNTTPSAGHAPPNTTYWQLLSSIGASYGGTSTTSLAIGTGSRAFTTQSGLAYQNGARVRASSASDPTQWVEGVATYSGTTLTINSDRSNGSGTYASWNLNIAGDGSGGAQFRIGNASPTFDSMLTVTSKDTVPGSDWIVSFEREGNAANNESLIRHVHHSDFSGTGAIPQPIIAGFADRGTIASPVVISSGDYLLIVDGRGYDGAGWSDTSAQMSFMATATWSNTSHPSKVVLKATPSGSTTPVVVATILGNKNAGFGTETNPQSPFVVSSNVTPGIIPPSGALGGTNFAVTGQDANNTMALIDTYSSGTNKQGFFLFRTSEGTAASKSAITSSSSLGQISWVGYDGSAYTGQTAAIVVAPSENWSGSAHGTYIDIYTTPSATTAIAKAARFNPSGGLSIGTSTDPGLGGLALHPQSSVTPASNGDLVVQATSNTSLTFKYKGSDGVVRSASLTLS